MTGTPAQLINPLGFCNFLGVVQSSSSRAARIAVNVPPVSIGSSFRAVGLLGLGLSSAQERSRAIPPEVADRIDWEAAKDISRAWCPLYKGIEHLALETEEPRRMRGQAPRIDLKTPGLSFLVNPSNGDRPLECDSISTSHFLGKHLLQAAITHQSLVSPVSVGNASPC